MTLKDLLKDFELQKNANKAKILARFFKTGTGEYGEGDIFLGLTVPEQRILAKKYISLTIDEIQMLLNSKIHEHRLTGLIILTYKYQEASKQKISLKEKEKRKKEIFDFYLKNSKKINNWDLVDLSCYRIVGDYLKDKDRTILYTYAKSKNLWQRRIAIVSTHAFIRNKDFKDTLEISKILLNDKHNLIHKAVGWMLREVGKKDEKTLKKFLNKNYKIMPRTALRYSIERLSTQDKLFYMKK